jgi:folate-dependent phosphoribosylglycinamide formyltransferase PurN
VLNIGWFSTGRDEAAQKLLETVWEQTQSHVIQGRINFVFSNREPGESNESDHFFQFVEKCHIPLITYSFEKFKRSQANLTEATTTGWPLWRVQYDREVISRLEAYPVDVCMMAGYMLIVGPEMCTRFNLLNLHPAVPGGPTGTWQEVIWKLIETRADHTGAMIHLATPELDRGPAITYFSLPIRGPAFDQAWASIGEASVDIIKKSEGEHNRLFQLIRERELAGEFPLIIITLKALAEGRISIRGGRVCDQKGQPILPCDMSSEISKMIAQVT